jgi:Sulfotransferase family
MRLGNRYLNCDADDAVPPECTVIISGPPRSGTSLIAAMLRACGLWLGDLPSNDNQEDTDIAFAIEPRPALSERIATAARNLDHPLLAARGIDVRLLRRKITTRNERFRKWGFKRPNVIAALRDGGTTLFRNPRIIVTFRDPIALAERIVGAHPFLPIENAIGIARNVTKANINATLAIKAPIMLISYDKVSGDREALLETLCQFCGLDVPSDGYRSVRDFVDAAHREYQTLREYA